MGLLPQVPTQAGQGGEWDVSDYLRASGQAKADATGAATVALPTVSSGQRWQITRAIVAASSTAIGCACRLYVTSGGEAPSQATLVSGTNSGNFDEADYPGDGLLVLDGEQLQAAWTGAVPGAMLTLSIIYRLMTR